MRAQDQIKVLGALTAVISGVLAVGVGALALRFWRDPWPTTDGGAFVSVLVASMTAMFAVSLCSGVVLGLLMLVPGTVARIASATLGLMFASSGIVYSQAFFSRPIGALAWFGFGFLVIGAYAIGLSVSAFIQDPGFSAQRSVFARWFGRQWRATLAAIAALIACSGLLAVVVSARDEAEERERRERREWNERAGEKRAQWKAAVDACVGTDDFWSFCGGIDALAVSGDGRFVATAKSSGKTKLSIWALEGRVRRTWQAEADVGQGPLGQLLLAPDGSRLALVTRDKVLVYDTADRRGRALFSVGQCGEERGLWVRGMGAAFAPDGRQIAAVGAGEICVFDSRTGRGLKSFPARSCRGDLFALTPDGTRVWAICNHRPTAFDLATGTQLLELDVWTSDKPAKAIVSDPVALSVTRDGDRVMVVGRGHASESNVAVWEARRGTLLTSFTVPVSPDARTIAVFGSRPHVAVGSSSSYAKVFVHDLETGNLVGTIDTTKQLGALAAAPGKEVVILGFTYAPYLESGDAGAPPATVKSWTLPAQQ